MGLYDTLIDKDGRHEQVKCFGQMMDYYRVGDEVPHLKGKKTYNILLVYGMKHLEKDDGYALIRNGKFQGFSRFKYKGKRVFDRWGRECNGTQSGE